MDLTVIQETWNEWYPVVLASLGTVIAVGGIILTVYLKLKPIYDSFKSKLDAVKDKVVNAEKDDITAKLESVNIQTKITDLEEKIANPLTSDNARASYTTQLSILIEVKTKLDAGLVTVDEVNNKF